MELKKSISKQHFDENAKAYIINMKNNSKKLHKKNNCQYSKHITEYYDFDTLEEVKNCGVNFTCCRNCFTEDEITNKQSNSENTLTPLEIYNKYNAYWSCRLGGLILFFLSAIMVFPCLTWLSDVDFSDFDSYGPIVFGLVSLAFSFIMAIVIIAKALKIKKEYKKYFTDRIKSAHKDEERLVKKIIIITSIIGSIIMAIVLIPILSDSKTSDNNYDNTCTFCGEKDATIGEYCRDCYKTLDNIRDAYE